MPAKSIEQLIADLDAIPDDQTLLQYALERSLAEVPPELANLLRRCALPHWFDPGVIGILRGRPDGAENEALCRNLASYAFVKTRTDGAYAYHEDARALLLPWWREPPQQATYHRVSARLATYLHNTVDLDAVIGELQSQAGARGSDWSRGLLRAAGAIYHTLPVDEAAGMAQAQALFLALSDAGEDAAAHYLLGLLEEQQPILSPAARQHVAALRAHYLVEIGEWQEAGARLAALLEEADVDAAVRPWLLLDLGRVNAYAGRRAAAQAAWEQARGLAEAASADELLARILRTLGEHYVGLQRFDQATTCMNQALSLERQRGNLQGEIAALRELGRIAVSRDAWQEAETVLQQSLALAEQGSDQAQVAAAYTALGELARSRMRWADAYAYFAHALEIYRTLDQRRNQVLILRQIGDTQLQHERYDQAHASYREALDLARLIGNRAEEGWSLHALGLLAEVRDRWDDALAWYEQARATFAALGLHEPMITVLQRIADTHRAAMRWEQAEEALHQALDIAVESGDQQLVALRYENLGFLEYYRDQWDAALAYYEQSLTIFRNLRLPLEEEVLFRVIGLVYGKTSQWEAAESALRQALIITQAEGTPSMIGIRLKDLARLARRRQNPVEARARYAEALALAESHGLRALEMDVLKSIGSLEASAHQWDAAEIACRRALDLAQAAGELKGAADSLVRLGNLAHQRERRDVALNYYQQALGIFVQLDLPSNQVLALGNIGLQLRLLGRWEEAEAAYRQSLDLAENHAAPGQMVDALYNLSLLAEQRERWDESIIYARRALGLAQATGQDSSQVYILSQIGDLEKRLQHWESAEATYREALACAQRGGDPQRIADQMVNLGHLARTREQWDSALAHYQAALTIYDDLGLQGSSCFVLGRIGQTQRERGRWNEAEVAFNAALELARARSDRRTEAWVLNDLGGITAGRDRWDEARRYYHAARAIFVELDMLGPRISTLRNLGNAERNLRHWDAAAAAYQEALDLLQRSGDREQEAWMWGFFGQMLGAQGRHVEALSAMERGAAIMADLDLRSAWAEIARSIGDEHRKTRRWDEANAMYDAVVTTLHAEGNPIVEAVAWANWGEVARDQERWDVARERYTRAVDILAEAGRGSDYIKALTGLGDIELAAQRWDAAASVYQQALDLARAEGYAQEAVIEQKRAQLAAAQGALDASVGHYQAAAAIYRRMSQPVHEGYMLLDLATLYMQVGEYQQATMSLAEAETHAPADERRADVSMRRGMIAISEGRLTDARTQFAEATAIKPKDWYSRAALAYTLLILGDQAAAHAQIAGFDGTGPETELAGLTLAAVVALHGADQPAFPAQLADLRAQITAAEAGLSVPSVQRRGAQAVLSALEGQVDLAHDTLEALGHEPLMSPGRMMYYLVSLALRALPRKEMP